MSLTTPPSVRELQKALYVKAKANPTYRFYALYDKIYRQDVLWWAWGCCRANGGGGGGGGASFLESEGRGGGGWVGEVRVEEGGKDYRPQGERGEQIPKADGEPRTRGR